MRERASPNWDARSQPIELVVLHYTGMADADVALARLTDPAPTAGRYPGPWQDPSTPPSQPLSRVSAHYLVEESGSIWRLVPEAARAWHAGAGAWEGREALNDRSIGIEIVNGGHDFGLPEYPEPQIESVVSLVRDILSRTGLTPWAVVGHSDVAPARKADPGERFPWRRLAGAGCSVWPEREDTAQPERPELRPEMSGEAVAALQADLRSFGYAAPLSAVFDPPTTACVMAFQRRFRPERVDGVADAAVQAALAALLAQKCRAG